MFCKYNCMISCGDTYNIIWQNIKVIKLGRYWPGINVNQYNITNVCWANSLQTMFLQLFHSKNTMIRPTLNLTQVRQNSDMYLALQLVNERYRYWVSTDTHWYWSVSVLVSNDTRFDTLTILHDLQSQACNVNQKFKWPALYRWLTYGWAPLIPLSHLVQPTEMLTVWWSCGYLRQGNIPQQQCPLAWWKANSSIYPRVAQVATCRPRRPLYPVNACSAPRATCTVTAAVTCCRSGQRCCCSLKKTFTCQTHWQDSWLTRHDESCVLFLTSAHVTPNLDFAYSILHVTRLVCHFWYWYWTVPRTIGIVVSATYWYHLFTSFTKQLGKSKITHHTQRPNRQWIKIVWHHWHHSTHTIFSVILCK